MHDELRRVRRARADLQAEYAALADPDEVALDDEHDSEGSTIGFERARVAGLIRRADTRITELEAAAARLSAGTYGRCGRCGRPIGAERLAALPSARLCVDCARLAGG